MSRTFFLENWRGKLASLVIALAIWYLITSHLESGNASFPVPGTQSSPPARSSSGPGLDEDLLGPLSAPVPGRDNLN